MLLDSNASFEPQLTAVRPAALQLDAIHAGYGRTELLHGLSLTVRQGEIVALIGPNGAGKSTVLRAAMGLLSLCQGTVRLDGRDVSKLPTHRRVALGLGYFIQGGQVFPSLSVAGNLRMGARLLPRARRQSAIESVLELFPTLGKKLPQRAGLLSGGQRQGLAMAMVLVQSPRVALLDEPSAGLAPNLAQEVLNKVYELNQRLGVTVLLVEQRIREVLQMSHRVVAIANGSVVRATNDPMVWVANDALDEMFFPDNNRDNNE